MSRLLLVFGLLVSIGGHVWLLQIPARPAPELLLPDLIVPVVETALAVIEPPAPPQETAPTAQVEEPMEPPIEQPKLVKVAEPARTEITEEGDFGGEAQGQPAPDLRIDWGTGSDAVTAMEAGAMILVVLDGQHPRPRVKHQLQRDQDTWRRQPYRPAGTTLYSNRLRIVDQVPAFVVARTAAELRLDERLAVLLPMRVERVLESAQMQAAFSRGLAMRDIDNFAGHFRLREGSLAFDITHVGQELRSATP